MNPRIRTLADQCIVEGMYNDDTGFYSNRIDIDKFAKLIVRECADVDLYWLSEQDRKAVAEKIKQHFGVQ